jgi:TPR repeat protein
VAAVLVALSPAVPAAGFDQGLAAFDAADYGLAQERWRACAREGIAACQYGLGVLHDEGLGVEQDVTEARRWYMRAARRDHPDALMRLGFLHAIGRGDVAQDPAQAWAWFARAASLGVPQAAEHRDRVGQMLTAEELARAQGLADELSIRHHLQKE